MGADSKIEWTDDTVNPWWGCVKVSPACTNCYAESLDGRWHGGAHWGPKSERLIRIDKAIAELDRIAARSDREGRPRRVFIASMADVFEDRADLVEPRLRLWEALHRIGPRIRALLLTKRPDVMATWAAEHGWPDGAWAGTTVEDQRRADERIPHLLRVPASVRFLSCEPLLGPVDLGFLWRHCWSWPVGKTLDQAKADGTARLRPQSLAAAGARLISWVIAGGESGPKARPMHPNWARSLRDQCRAVDVPFHFKQWGEWAPGEAVEANGADWPGMHEPYREDGGAPRHHWPDAPVRETARRLGKGDVAGDPHELACDTVVLRVGKKAAGRFLDGRTWDEVPS